MVTYKIKQKTIFRKDDGLLRTMNTEKLLKTLPILQKQVDALIQFDVNILKNLYIYKT